MAGSIALRRMLLGSLVLILLPGALQAQDALPPAAEIIDRYVEAVGGRDAVLALTRSRATGTFAMPSAGLSGQLEVIADKPGRLVTRVTLPGLGEMRSGYDGEVGWSLNPMQGPRLLEGRELAALVDQSNPLYGVRDASLFTAMETEARTEIGGEACYMVRFAWKSGRESRECYSVETGLAIGTISTEESAMGSVESRTRLEDYREVRGVLMAMRSVVEVMGQQQIITIESIDFDGIEESDFALPAEIRTLVQQRTGAGS